LQPLAISNEIHLIYVAFMSEAEIAECPSRSGFPALTRLSPLPPQRSARGTAWSRATTAMRT
ncbi:hypothetical protein, partial [Paraburkholderia sp. RL18-103-BIB-C]|uniref:hypothetical protein n=1 Tax=Paraburkholderia sp. RL18-103-BIB-C TaxID=3031637 RepID=UPI0038BCF224